MSPKGFNAPLLSIQCATGWPSLVYTHRKTAQTSPKYQVEWLHLWTCLIQSWCGASRTIWDCYSSRGIRVS